MRYAALPQPTCYRRRDRRCRWSRWPRSRFSCCWCCEAPGTASHFAAANVRRFLVAAALAAFGQLGAFVSSIAEMNAKADLDLVISVQTSLVWVPVAFVFYALATVFRRGVSLRDDVALTI